VRIEGEPKQAALADGRDLIGDIEKDTDRAGRQIEDLDRAGSLDDEQPAGVAGRRGGEDRLVEPGRDPNGRNRRHEISSPDYPLRPRSATCPVYR
jgi:hypothetical protein